MKQLVLPIKDSNILHEVEDTLLNNFKAGRRSYTIFQVGKATLLRVSDVLALRRTEIFNDDETVVKNAYIRDKKTSKPNILYLKSVKQNLHSDWLFPSIQHPNRHIYWETILQNYSQNRRFTRYWLLGHPHHAENGGLSGLHAKPLQYRSGHITT